VGKLAITGGDPVRAKDKPWPQWPVSDEKDTKRIADITRSNQWSFDGPAEWEFATRFTAYQRGKYGLCCANGTVGIQIALEALGVGAYDEVIVPGMTWQATAAACLDVNAIPILVDVEPDTWCIDVDAIEAAITKRTRAVIVVHLYGCVPDIAKIQRLCKKHGLFLIEDCAHQHGTFWKDKGVGTFGDISSFSFQESKVLSSGEGGFNICKSKVHFERLYSLRNCGRGWHDDMTHTLQSGNYRLTEWQAGMLHGALDRLDKQVKLRDRNAMHLNAQLASIPGVLPMRRRPEVTQQSYFNFAFRIDPKQLKGVTNAAFRRALNAELHPTCGQFDAPYQPLNNCELYKPHTKPRHKLSPEYWKALNPRRFKLPVCKDAHERTGIVIHHFALMGSKQDTNDIARAVAKVVENIDELKK
jgi:L-glutamine:2-deoxy-scyllo-inosose/3-amino-2,3-dideoxy-scyllo-inosose aminotransferase